MAHVKGITTLGPHNMTLVSKKDYEAAKAYGTHVVPLRKFRSIGATPRSPYSRWGAGLRIDRHRQLLSVDRARHPSATVASPTTKPRTSCAKWLGASRWLASISSRSRPLRPVRDHIAPRGPASISSDRSSTSARSGVADRGLVPQQGTGLRLASTLGPPSIMRRCLSIG